MPLLAGLLTSLFGGVAAFFSAWMTKKAAFAVAAVTTFAALTVGLFAAMTLLFSGLIVAFPEASPVVLTGLWVALPDNAIPIVAICISTDTAVALYRWNVENLRLAAYVT